jgi:hypothetical protein
MWDLWYRTFDYSIIVVLNIAVCSSVRYKNFAEII